MMTTKTKIIETRNRSVLDLKTYMKSGGHTLMCVGPMSMNTVEAVVDYANAIQAPIPLIASRRQIESEEFGGGYVNNWNSEAFGQYVMSRDKGFVHICRDHGGPWQGNNESNLSQAEAMDRAKAALLDDIASGFDIVHLDPSIKGGALTDSGVLSMLFELYSFVCESAAKLGRNIEIEVGAEQQSGEYSDPHELVGFLKAITNFCEQQGFKKPLFCVVQTGTLVKEMRNVGFTEGRRNDSLDQKYAVNAMEKTLRYLVDIACINGVFVKEHNGDYLSDGSMSLRNRLGVGAVNVAPELGVFESKCLIQTCLELGQPKELEKLAQIFYSSKKWEKWLSADSTATDLEKAIIAGHYTFSTPEFLEVKARIQKISLSKGIELDSMIKSSLTAQLKRMTWNVGYFSNVLARAGSSRSARTLTGTFEASAQPAVNSR